jgi:hypothetical protein
MGRPHDQHDACARCKTPAAHPRAPAHPTEFRSGRRTAGARGPFQPAPGLWSSLSTRGDSSADRSHPSFVRGRSGGMPELPAGLDAKADRSRDFRPLNGDRASRQKSVSAIRTNAALEADFDRLWACGARRTPAPRSATRDLGATLREAPNAHAACGVRPGARADLAASYLASAPRPTPGRMLATRRGRPAGRRRFSPRPRSLEGFGP